MKYLVCKREEKLVFFLSKRRKTKTEKEKNIWRRKIVCHRRRRKQTNLFERENVTDVGRHMMKKGGKRYSASRWKIIA